jgi:CDP-glucose 4,6-dehydratase
VGERARALEGLVMRRPDPAFWRGRSVLLTGHTGFKGAWLALMLHRLGAEVTGFALAPEAGPTAFELLQVERLVRHRVGDLLDNQAVAGAVNGASGSVVLHLAAQAIVARGYDDPAGTFATNVGGTINLLQALRRTPGCQAAVIVTSDKVYRNDGVGRAFREADPLGGHDPYSASKAACEIAVASFAASFPDELPLLATARAGNVIGGGDFGPGRLVPDIVRADIAGEALTVRRPDATRPFQHVLDVLAGYLLLAEDLASRPGETPRAVNFGPSEPETRVRDLIEAFGSARGRPVDWLAMPVPTMEEAPRLALDSALARSALGWRPVLDARSSLAATAGWYASWMRGEDLFDRSYADIDAVLASEAGGAFPSLAKAKP